MIVKVDEVIYEECDGKVKNGFKDEYIGIKGVWALFGKENADSDYVCIQVGKCEDVGKEIIYDLGCFHLLPFRKDGTKKYLNYLAEDCGFMYQSNQVQEYLYPYIALHYYSIKFVYVCEENSNEKEKEYAEKHYAYFWRNGHPFGIKNETNWMRKDIQTIGNYFLNGGETYSLEELLNKIEVDLGFGEKRCKRLIKECERLGIIYCVNDDIYTK